MRTTAFAAVLLLAACSSGPSSGTRSVPGQGAIAVQIIPNPIVAKHVSGDRYDFPFEAVVRESGGRPVTIHRVSARVRGPGGIQLAEEAWNADRIRSMGYPTQIAANSEVRYEFNPRKSVPDDRLFGSVSAELRVEGIDDTGAPTDARTVVTVRR
jgi:hypothetical protein